MSAACTTYLSGVRVFLHIRHGVDDVKGRGGMNYSDSRIEAASKDDGDYKATSVQEIRRTARAHVRQLGATLVLSEAAADLIVFHRGNGSFLETTHNKLKTVVRPDYLAACIAAKQQLNVDPYIINPAASSRIDAINSSARRTLNTPTSAIGAFPTGIGNDTVHYRSTGVVTAAPLPSIRSPRVSPTPTTTPIKNRKANHAPIIDDEKCSNKNEENGKKTASADLPTSSSPPQAHTLAVEQSDDLDQQCNVDVVSTPLLTPSSRQEYSGVRRTGAGAVNLPDCGNGNTHDGRDTAPVEKRSAYGEEEEAIRHMVLRSTATSVVTQRRHRPPKQEDATPEPAETTATPVLVSDAGLSELAQRGEDPFLHSASSTQPRPRSREVPPPFPSNASEQVSPLTQPLPVPLPVAPTVVLQPTSSSALSAAPTEMTSKRHRSPSDADKEYSRDRAHWAHTARLGNPPNGRPGRIIKNGNAVGRPSREDATKSVKEEHQHRRRRGARQRGCISTRRITDAPRNRERTPPTDPPFSITFTDLALLHRITPVDSELQPAAAALCVAIMIDDAADDDAGYRSSSGSGVTSSTCLFMRDVVVQLGATCILLGSYDGNDGGQSYWFARSRHAHAGQKPTHLVVDPNAMLTPDLLYYKALGIPTVTPQWVYDAIVLGMFPAILPHIHAHPVYGDRPVADAGAMGAMDTSITAAAALAREGLLGDEEESGGALTEEVGRCAHTRAVQRSSSHNKVASAAAPSATTSCATAATARVRCPPCLGGSSTVRQLHKEVRDEYVPVGEQAMRPLYVPIFHDRMFYLYVPPVDLASATARDGACERLRSHRVSRGSLNGGRLGDVTAALAQVTELLRILGGTVTRNVESTYLDAVIDLTGFYDNMAGVRQMASKQQSQENKTRTLRESLTCAYHDALQRVSQGSSSLHARTAAPTPTTSRTTVPVLGIGWLIHSILTRQWTAVESFSLPEHPIAAQLSAVHASPPSIGIQTSPTETMQSHARRNSNVTLAVINDESIAVHAQSSTDVADAHTPQTPSSHEEAAESTNSVWSALMESRCKARKHP